MYKGDAVIIIIICVPETVTKNYFFEICEKVWKEMTAQEEESGRIKKTIKIRIRDRLRIKNNFFISKKVSSSDWSNSVHGETTSLLQCINDLCSYRPQNDLKEYHIFVTTRRRLIPY